MFRLPDIADFKKGGIFSSSKVKKNTNLPPEIMSFVFPDYTEILFKQKPGPGQRILSNLNEYCISIKKIAQKEDRQQRIQAQKEFETRQLEEKIKDYFDNFYKSKYKHCTCHLKEH